MFAGFLIEAKAGQIWDIPVPDFRFEEALHGFGWLDDLAAVDDGAARTCAQTWTFDWMTRFGRGSGPGWTPDLTGRRLIRWINHAILLLNGRDKAQARAYFRSLGQQTIFLARRWKTATPGLPRFEALTGLIYAGLSLTGMERHVAVASAALARECAREVDADGGIPTRNPEELLQVFTLLTWASRALVDAGRRAAPDHLAAIERIAPTLRALRHSDGGLARFHGGGRGGGGGSGSGFGRKPPQGADRPRPDDGFRAIERRAHQYHPGCCRAADRRHSINAHASTLAFELTSGRRAMIVNCGSGAGFGAEWRRAGRATPSHSTLCIRGFSSSRLGSENGGPGARAELDEVPEQVWAQSENTLDGIRLLAGHNGYAPTHGMTHLREIALSRDGRVLTGEDTLAR